MGLPSAKADETEVKRLRKVIAKHKPGKLDRKELRDAGAEQMRALIEKKRAKDEDVVRVQESERAEAEVVDIMETLKRSLAGLKR